MIKRDKKCPNCECRALGYAGCELGSGCTSGAGTLDQIASEVGVEELVRLIAEEVLPWLKGEEM